MEGTPEPQTVTREARIGAALIAEALGVEDSYDLVVGGEGDSLDITIQDIEPKLGQRLDVIPMDSTELTQ